LTTGEPLALGRHVMFERAAVAPLTAGTGSFQLSANRKEKTMRREPHPISGADYQEVGEGIVRVRDPKSGKTGTFRWDGTWIEGELTHADPHYLIYVGGPNLPDGKDIYWGVLPPVDQPTAADPGAAYASRRSMAEGEQPRSPIVAKYIADPGRPTDRGMRSAGFVDLDYILSHDRRPELVPDVFWLESPAPGGPTKVPTARYYEKRYHDLEVERIWKRAWQMACLEDDIPNVGDYHVYEIANLSFLIVRTGEHEFKAHYNACLHRGRLLRECDGKGATEFRCPYHGWKWALDGALKEITCEWDFPGVREDVSRLPGAQVATWGGFVFINPDPDAMPLEEFLGPVMMGHYEKFRFQNRYKQVHVQRVMDANWKVTMEAFMEGYHVIATHPQIMLTGGDSADLRYDVFGHWGRASHVSAGSASPQRGIFQSKEDALAQFQVMADANREYLRGLIGDEVERYSDAEMNDAGFNDLFPNLHPWAGWARLVFRFRPLGDNPDASLMDVIYLAPWPEGKPKPPAAAVHRLSVDQSWCDAPELGSLARIIDQDVFNLPKVQAGLKTKQPPYVWYSAYQEGKIRNFHANYDRWMGLSED
jgi:phenylpropionate dioxygenase-like ring-hydroxylating dioxygenase large terminal subunit